MQAFSEADPRPRKAMGWSDWILGTVAALFVVALVLYVIALKLEQFTWFSGTNDAVRYSAQAVRHYLEYRHKFGDWPQPDRAPAYPHLHFVEREVAARESHGYICDRYRVHNNLDVIIVLHTNGHIEAETAVPVQRKAQSP